MSDQVGVDLSAFDIETGADRGAKLELLDKHGNKSGEWIQLLGADSKEYQAREAIHKQRRLNRLQKFTKITNADMENEIIERLVLCTKDWSFKVGNDKLPLSPQNIENIYRKSLLIREQVEFFVNDRANFTLA